MLGISESMQRRPLTSSVAASSNPSYVGGGRSCVGGVLEDGIVMTHDLHSSSRDRVAPPLQPESYRTSAASAAKDVLRLGAISRRCASGQTEVPSCIAAPARTIVCAGRRAGRVQGEPLSDGWTKRPLCMDKFQQQQPTSTTTTIERGDSITSDDTAAVNRLYRMPSDAALTKLPPPSHRVARLS